MIELIEIEVQVTHLFLNGMEGIGVDGLQTARFERETLEFSHLFECVRREEAKIESGERETANVGEIGFDRLRNGVDDRRIELESQLFEVVLELAKGVLVDGLQTVAGHDQTFDA